MAVLEKSTIQKLAVLRGVSLWRRGAYGPVRVHKTLFFAEQKSGETDWNLFTFKRWRLGQYSDEIALALNELRQAGCIQTVYDGPCERILATISNPTLNRIKDFFSRYFTSWHKAIEPAFREWAYLSTDAVIEKAHEDESYTKKKHGEVILRSFQQTAVEFEGLSRRDAEALSDAVDTQLQTGLRERIQTAVNKKLVGEDWRAIYFSTQKQSA